MMIRTWFAWAQYASGLRTFCMRCDKPVSRWHHRRCKHYIIDFDRLPAGVRSYLDADPWPHGTPSQRD